MGANEAFDVRADDDSEPGDASKSGQAVRRRIVVVAATPDGVIGSGGDLPWRLRRDLQRFKRTTMGGVLVMGRKTFDSIGRPLPGRQTVVITAQSDWSAAGVVVAPGPSEALRQADQLIAPGDSKDASGLEDDQRRCPVFVVGGATIYQALLPECDELWLTTVLSRISGDVHLSMDRSRWRAVETVRYPAGAADQMPTEFHRLVRR
ncbi:dihydrofolate reductase [Crateriforma conspicua]|uniref:dihydrofolate reductase n=1 Tax=Crateriforma conspicua TaxID=2527996 RepID=A0A5C5Y7M8_9PLAN|nr:dihydrofolate reductase [Crateriforma conspicua]TWT70305.1 Dihydrofolate reductase type 3 [Crateriforma conspicua]